MTFFVNSISSWGSVVFGINANRRCTKIPLHKQVMAMISDYSGSIGNCATEEKRTKHKTVSKAEYGGYLAVQTVLSVLFIALGKKTLRTGAL